MSVVLLAWYHVKSYAHFVEGDTSCHLAPKARASKLFISYHYYLSMSIFVTRLNKDMSYKFSKKYLTMNLVDTCCHQQQ